MDLQLKELCDIRHEKQIPQALKEMPRTLHKTYDLMHDAILNERGFDQHIATAIIQWIMHSRWPPSAEELVGVAYWSAEHDSERVLYSFDDILAVCHHFIVLDEDQDIVRFIHLSAREYLEKLPAVAQNSVVLASRTQSKLHLRVCLHSLMNPDINMEDEENLEDLRVIQDYCHEFWSDHLKTSEEWTKHSEDDKRLVEQFLGTHSSPGEYFLRVIDDYTQDIDDIETSGLKYRHFVSSPVTPFFTAVVCGLERFIEEHCIRDIQNTDITNEIGETGLYLASRRGYDSLVRIFLRNGANQSVTVGEREYTPLHAAAEKNRLETAKVLAGAGGDINAALPVASGRGFLPMVKLLLAHGADVNYVHENDPFPTALHVAAGDGQKEIAEFLLDQGADREALVGNYGSPLQSAVNCGELDIVKFLIIRGANVDAPGGSYGTILHAAVCSQYWDLEIVKQLTLAGADVNCRAELYSTPLHSAVLLGRYEIAEHLIELGADVNARIKPLAHPGKKYHYEDDDEDDEVAKLYDTPLQSAAASGEIGLVELLLEHGADINIATPRGTALTAAVDFKEWVIARLLLDRDADSACLGDRRHDILENIKVYSSSSEKD